MTKQRKRFKLLYIHDREDMAKAVEDANSMFGDESTVKESFDALSSLIRAGSDRSVILLDQGYQQEDETEGELKC
ncbi:MAG TPA: hypothetical protein DHV59_01010 [Oxalobacteraceae bacterium]|nr:hypothetical protein [Oxalobacteraceae bacterium]